MVQPVTDRRRPAAVILLAPAPPGASPQPRAAALRYPRDPRSPACPKPCGSHSCFLLSLIQILPFPRPPTPRRLFDSEPALGQGRSGRIQPTQRPDFVRPVSLPEPLHLRLFWGSIAPTQDAAPRVPAALGGACPSSVSFPGPPTPPRPKVGSDPGEPNPDGRSPAIERIRSWNMDGWGALALRAWRKLERPPLVSRVSFFLDLRPRGLGQGCRRPSVSPSAGFSPRGPQWLALGRLQAASG